MKTSHHSTPPANQGGLARYFVEHREVAWLFLFATLILGWVAYTRLPQQEDPSIPFRGAIVVTRWDGATAAKIEDLVTRKLEKKISEMESLEKIKSESRPGLSVIKIELKSQPQWRLDAEWDKLRAKLSEVPLPAGTGAPRLDSDFGISKTIVLAIASEPVGPGELKARAQLIEARLREVRGSESGGRAAFVFFPAPGTPAGMRADHLRRLAAFVEAQSLGTDPRFARGEGFYLLDLQTNRVEAELAEDLSRFERQIRGSDREAHPDAWNPLVVGATTDLVAALHAQGHPRLGYRALEKIAEDLEDRLKQVGSVGKTEIYGRVPEVVNLRFTPQSATGYRVDVSSATGAVAARNTVIAGGALSADGRDFPVQFSGEFKTEEDLLGTVVGTGKDGRPVYARDLFEVERGYESPISFRVETLARVKGETTLQPLRSVILNIEMRDGEIVQRFDQAVRAATGEFSQTLPPGARLERVSDQPRSVENRVQNLLHAFFEALLVVVGVSLLLMDWRSAVVVALAVPLTLALTLAGLWILHIPIHQLSIAALIISLGMLVDDPVVATDGINRELAAGHSKRVAAWFGPFRLRRAILFGTIINVFAFLPMVLLPSDVGAFVIALPLGVSLSLVASRIVSMTFVPLLGSYLLRGQKGLEEGGELRSFPLFRWVDQLMLWALPRYQRLLESALAHPYRALAVGGAALLASFALVPFIGKQFFPSADRNQFLIEVKLPEAATITQTREVSAQIRDVLSRDPRVVNAAVFIGGSTPRFYYNIESFPAEQSVASILVNTRSEKDTPELIAALRPRFDREIVGARVLVKPLEQGPPVGAPIQVRLSGEDRDKLRALADQVAASLRAAGAYKVSDDLGRRQPNLWVEIDQERANTLGVDNQRIAGLARVSFTGLTATELREGDHLVPVRFQIDDSERAELSRLAGYYVESSAGAPLPLASFADVRLRPEFSKLARYNQLRTVTVSAYAPLGELPASILERAKPAVTGLALPTGVTMAFGAEDEKIAESNQSMLLVMALSVGLIALTMVIQFGSVAKAMTVVVVTPLGLIGALVGLAVLRAPLGFMAMIGVVSLIGVIVSHIIVLSDYIEEALAEGVALKEALVQAGLVRLRAVLATTFATVGGLIPLNLGGGSLWESLTSVHIFGLLFATMLTLILLPTVYYLFAARWKWIR